MATTRKFALVEGTSSRPNAGPPSHADSLRTMRRFVLLCAALLTACGGSDESGTVTDSAVADAAGSDTSTSVDTGTTVDSGTASDSATTDTGAPMPDVMGETSAGCNDLAQLGAEVFADRVAMPYPSAFTGGTIAPGTYTLTKITEYTGAGGMTGKDTTAERQTLLIAGSSFNIVRKSGSAPEKRFTSSFTVAGSKATFVDSCPKPQTVTLDYSATATTLEQGLKVGSLAFTFTYTKK